MEQGEQVPIPMADPAKKMRQIIIETDGNSIKLVKTEVAGTIELVGILQSLIEYVKNGK